MTQEKDKLINLSVHESSVPSLLDVDRDKQAPEHINDLNDSVPDNENVDVPTPQPFDDVNKENLGNKQITIANLSAG
ncbi:hypothetical protein IQ259_07095 [Fortiea sp. LEGE XX443]|uniref:hypothetical protein n=1 Tax=Fortiea sp. LEGE XX443 TaxID=1828611 RepID=UPI00187FEF9F|nr:hypothetical protein [Fortiea sp. LEGE XX443]MBE9004803.1 hypothetical protein [Fortiea sp. LEGE XX443]